jgi:hypothetical protein
VKKIALLLATTVLTLAYAREARAVEQEHQLGVDVGAAMLTIADKATPDFGPAFGLHYGYGITDQFNLLVELQYSLLALGTATPAGTTPASGAPPASTSVSDPAQLWNADIGVTYILDVLRWVPYFGALAGAYVLDGGSLPGALVLPGAQIVVGLDYLVTPKWGVGFELSEHFLFTDMSLYTSYSTAFVRMEFRWGK